MYGLIGSFKAASGKRDELIAILLSNVETMPGCRSYIVAEIRTDPRRSGSPKRGTTKRPQPPCIRCGQGCRSKAMPLVHLFSEHREPRVIGGQRRR
jgi:hypothetical protein